MIARIQVELGEIKGGWLARAPNLKLSRAGKSESEALAALKRTLQAYCAALMRDGTLEAALQQRQVEVTGPVEEGCEIILSS